MGRRRFGPSAHLGAHMAGSFRYRAFISYSHRDRRWGRWLLRAIETYRVPRRLVGQATFRGEVPRRLAPVFRDRDELPAAEDLSVKVREALEQSEFLIIVCSPHAAASRWVNQEILEFKRLRGEDNLLAVIVDGEPFASARDGDGEECFPPALRRRVGPDGALTEARAEPVAADLRREGDGRRLGRLKLVAGMLGLSLDQLIQRDLQRRHRRVTAITAASLVGVLAMGALTLEAVDARREAEHRRGEAEGLIEFMLTDLRKKLEPVGRLDVLDAVGEEAIGYYAAQRLMEMPDDSIGRRARAFHLLGEIDELQGDLHGAEEMFQEAWDATAALLSRTPNDTQRIFDHAQSVYWLGYLDWRRGNFAEAEAAFRSYKELAERLVSIEPANLDYVLELAYAHSNLGTLYLGAVGEPRKAYSEFLESANLFSVLVEKQQESIGSSDTYYGDLSDSYAWLADSLEYIGSVDDVLKYRIRQQTLLLERAKNLGSQYQIWPELVACYRALARASGYRGNFEAQHTYYSDGIELAKKLVKYDPLNRQWKEYAALIIVDAAQASASQGNFLRSTNILLENHELLSGFTEVKLLSSPRDFRIHSNLLITTFLIKINIGSNILFPYISQDILRNNLDKIKQKSEAIYYKGYFLLLKSYQIENIDRKENIVLSIERYLDSLPLEPLSKSFRVQSVAFHLNQRIGRKRAAKNIMSELESRGYRGPAMPLVSTGENL